jgi:alkylation response protein AidB-like acyl-CoA dehydrogenase
VTSSEAATAAGSEHAAPLRQSVTDFIQRGTDIARVRKLRDTAPGYDRKVWQQMAGFGWTGILVPEEHGGLGLGLHEMAIVLEGLARVLVPEPLNAGAVLAATAIRESGNQKLKGELLPALVEGEVIPALAWQERAGDLDGGSPALSARSFEGALKLSGEKRFVHGGLGADGYAVTAQLDGDLALVWVPADAGGVAAEPLPQADGRSAATVRFKDVVVPKANVLAAGATASAALARAFDDTRVMASAELLGTMTRALDMSVDYMKTRVQFGKPIGSFQSLAHRAVNLHLQKELSSAALDAIVAELDRGATPQRRALLASRLKARCAEAGTRVTREAIQIHGAIGFTDEYDVGLYTKRAMVLAAWLGNAHAHRRRYAALATPEE